jgi:hypothetical protein
MSDKLKIKSMKPFRLPVLFLAITILIIGCKKKDNGPANYFSFKGKTYEISEALVDKNIIDSLQGLHIDQYGFLSVSGKDSAMLFLAVADLPANELTGTFSSLDINSSANRRIITMSSYAGSLIILPNKETYFTGLGGTFDVALSGVNYTISLNSISAGVYSGNIGGGTQYTEAGTIRGKYTGTPQTATITAYDGKSNHIFNSIIETYKEFLRH